MSKRDDVSSQPLVPEEPLTSQEPLAPEEKVPMWHVSASEIGALIEVDGGSRYRVALRHGTLEAGLYAPRGSDPQEPHEQDEVYVVHQGSGTFVCDGTDRPFGPGDLIFVPAGLPHRFEDFTDDLAVWVIFYGPKGGEEPG